MRPNLKKAQECAQRRRCPGPHDKLGIAPCCRESRSSTESAPANLPAPADTAFWSAFGDETLNRSAHVSSNRSASRVTRTRTPTRSGSRCRKLARSYATLELVGCLFGQFGSDSGQAQSSCLTSVFVGNDPTDRVTNLWIPVRALASMVGRAGSSFCVTGRSGSGCLQGA